MHIIVWNSGRLNYSELPNFLLSDVNGEYFAKKVEKGKILGSLLDKVVENLEDHGCPKFKISLMNRYGIARITQSDRRSNFTAQSARQNCLVTG